MCACHSSNQLFDPCLPCIRLLCGMSAGSFQLSLLLEIRDSVITQLTQCLARLCGSHPTPSARPCLRGWLPGHAAWQQWPVRCVSVHGSVMIDEHSMIVNRLRTIGLRVALQRSVSPATLSRGRRASTTQNLDLPAGHRHSLRAPCPTTSTPQRGQAVV